MACNSVLDVMVAFFCPAIFSGILQFIYDLSWCFQRQNHIQHRRDFCNILIIIHSKMIKCSLDYKSMIKSMIENS